MTTYPICGAKRSPQLLFYTDACYMEESTAIYFLTPLTRLIPIPHAVSAARLHIVQVFCVCSVDKIGWGYCNACSSPVQNSSLLLLCAYSFFSFNS